MAEQRVEAKEGEIAYALTAMSYDSPEEAKKVLREIEECRGSE